MTLSEFQQHVEITRRLEEEGNVCAYVREAETFVSRIQEKYGKPFNECVRIAVRTRSYIPKPAITSFRRKYFFLSNFYPLELEFAGSRYPTSEHAFQALKTADLGLRLQFTTTGDLKTPSQAKRAGQRLPRRADWEKIKIDVMTDILRIKFKDEYCRIWLVDTFPAELVEGNDWGDKFWGVCAGGGLNHLGKILMKIREDIIYDRHRSE